jgi:PD-(D/E)XK nuclease superfamily
MEYPAMETMDAFDVFEVLDNETVDTTKADDVSYKLTSKKDYHQLKRYQNVTSYSLLLELHSCPRKLQLARHNAGKDSNPLDNIDFAFGHAVGAGVQSLFQTGNLQTALFNSFMAWNISFDARIQKSKKSIWEAAIAVEKFLPVIVESLEEWELVWIGNEDTLKPGIELAFSIDCNNGYKHYGHIDVVLKNKVTGEVAVIELKTTGLKYAEEAVYANSSQATGYSIILDTIFPGISSYEVFHFIYSSSDREWTAMPFTKTVSHKSEWIKDLLLDHAMLDKYEELRFYPKRGESCYNYFRRCEFFGSCNIVPDESLPRLDMSEAAELVDFELNLADVIAAQQRRIV